jgi:hypothetical protein
MMALVLLAPTPGSDDFKQVISTDDAIAVDVFRATSTWAPCIDDGEEIVDIHGDVSVYIT